MIMCIVSENKKAISPNSQNTVGLHCECFTFLRDYTFPVRHIM